MDEARRTLAAFGCQSPNDHVRHVTEHEVLLLSSAAPELIDLIVDVYTQIGACSVCSSRWVQLAARRTGLGFAAVG